VSIATVVTRGFGPDASIALIVTAGYSVGAAAAAIPLLDISTTEALVASCVLSRSAQVSSVTLAESDVSHIDLTEVTRT